MLNLLPTEEKNAVRLEYRRRLWSVALVMSLFILFCVALMLLPSFVKVNLGIAQIKNTLDVLNKKPAVSDYQDLESAIKETKAKLETLNKGTVGYVQMADEIKRALKNKPDGIRIENIIWLSSGDSGKELMLDGKAANRDSLSKYYAALNSDNAFAGVTLPISDFAKQEGAQFSITINVSKKTNETKK
jgi:Tfp pilus assembly protein PilN